MELNNWYPYCNNNHILVGPHIIQISKCVLYNSTFIDFNNVFISVTIMNFNMDSDLSISILVILVV